MKKFGFILCAAALALASTFTACTNEDNSTYPDGIVIRNGYSLDSIYAQALAKATGDEITIQLPAGVEVFQKGDIEVEEGYKLTIIGDAAQPAKVNAKGGFITSNSIVIKNVNFAINEAVEVPFIKLNTLPEEGLNEKGAFEIDEITLDGVQIEGLSQQLVFSNGLKYLVKNITVNNSTIGIKGKASGTRLFSFYGVNSGNTLNLTVNNSVIYADASSKWGNGDFFSSQLGNEVTSLSEDEDATWNFTLTNNTFYRVSNSARQPNTLRQNKRTWQYFVITNNKFADCGQNGNFLVNLSGGSVLAENWTINGNIVNWGGEDVSETEEKNVGIEGATTPGIVDVTPFEEPAE